MKISAIFSLIIMELDALSSKQNAFSPVFAFTAAIFVYLIIPIYKHNRRNSYQTRKYPPEVGGAWPIIGHLPQLAGPQPPHLILAKMADKYGPIFTIRQGVHRTLVVSGSDVARECFTVNDKSLANRPDFVSFHILGYSRALFPFSPYGDYWRQVRKISAVELISARRLEMIKHVREFEVKESLKRTFDTLLKAQNNDNPDGNDKVLVDMKNWFGDITLNVMFRMVVGKRFVGADDKDGLSREIGNEQCRKAFREFFDMTGAFVLSDAVPFLRWLDLGGHQKAMKKVAKVLDKIINGWLDEHKEKMKECGGYDEEFFKGEHDFMDVMLSIVERDRIQQLGNYGADTVIKATCLTLILAGTDTTTVTLTWALSLLLNHPETLKKAQEELDMQLGRERVADESDLKNLVYLQAILKETMRLYPPGPLSVPHESLEDCTIGGYYVPSGTRLLVNLWKIHTDPNVWTDPLEFKPERFLTTHKDVDVKGQNFELIPFGSGRRMCPGMSFALQVTQLTLANLLHAFDIVTPSNEPVDMTEQTGLSNLKATPLRLLLSPRLPLHVYKELNGTMCKRTHQFLFSPVK